MKVVLASGNRGKLKELGSLLQPLGMELLPQSQFDMGAADETASTFVENALIKARHASLHTRLPAIADDSGICVEALDGAPGIYSARFAGAAASDEDNNRQLLEVLRGQDRAAAYYYCAIVYLRSPTDPTPLLAIGTWHGCIVQQPRGSNGFGYDPLFEVSGQRLTAAELDPVLKNRISHRGQAVRTLIDQIGAMGVGKITSAATRR